MPVWAQPRGKGTLQADGDRGQKETIMSSSSFVTSSVSVLPDSECRVCPQCCWRLCQTVPTGTVLRRALCHHEKEGRASPTTQIKGERAVAFAKCSLWSWEACRLFCPRERRGVIPGAQETALFCHSYHVAYFTSNVGGSALLQNITRLGRDSFEEASGEGLAVWPLTHAPRSWRSS